MPPHAYDSPVFDANIRTMEEHRIVYENSQNTRSLLGIAVAEENNHALSAEQRREYTDAGNPSSEALERRLDAEERELRALERTMSNRRETGIVTPQSSSETSSVSSPNVDPDLENYSNNVDESSIFLPMGIPILQVISVIYIWYKNKLFYYLNLYIWTVFKSIFSKKKK